MEADKKQKSPTVPRLRVICLECVVWSLIRGWNVDSEFVREVCENKNTGVSVPREWFEKSRTSTRTTTLNFFSKTSHTSCQCHKKIEKKWQIFIFAVSIVGWLKAIVRDLGLQSNVFFFRLSVGRCSIYRSLVCMYLHYSQLTDFSETDVMKVRHKHFAVCNEYIVHCWMIVYLYFAALNRFFLAKGVAFCVQGNRCRTILGLI